MVNGPCSSWVTGAEVLECCAAAGDEVGTFTSLLDDAADAASELLYELSGRRFAGLCTRTVRPCHSACSCGVQVLSRGHLVYDPYIYRGGCEGRSCGCNDFERIPLAGTVRDVSEVKIDGLIVDPDTYDVQEWRWLVRTDGTRWPRCANTALPDTEEGTFSVTYTYGKAPPLMGIEAAKKLACEIWKQCSSSTADCAIPDGATRITRQGITIDRGKFVFNARGGGWQTGIGAVDLFLNAYNPRGLARRALFFGPGRRRFPRPVG